MIMPLSGMVCAFFLLFVLCQAEYKNQLKNQPEQQEEKVVSPDERLLAAADKGDYLLLRYLLNKKADCKYQFKKTVGFLLCP